MAALIICKSDEESIENRYHPDNIFLSLWGPHGQVTLLPKVETGPKFEFVWDFMPTLIICKFDEDLIKNEVAIIQTFSPFN